MKLTAALLGACVFAGASPATAAPTDHDRRLGAIMGALVADAAIMPLHWIYNQTELADLTGGRAPEFFDPPSCPYYNYTNGENTPYGQQARQYLGAIAEHGFDRAAMQTAFFDFYGAKDAPCALHATEEVPCPPAQPNVTCCYWDASTIGFVDNVRQNATCMDDFSCGIDDSQSDALTHMILAVFRGGSDFSKTLDEVEDVVRLTQNADDAAAYGRASARVLHNALSGASASGAVAAAAKDLLDVNRVGGRHQDFVLGAGLHLVTDELGHLTNEAITTIVGPSCDYPNNAMSGSHILNQVMAPGTAGAYNVTEAFVNATRQLILAGGDQASRGMFVGSVLGAVGGEAAIPDSWKARYTHYDETKALALKALARASE